MITALLILLSIGIAIVIYLLITKRSPTDTSTLEWIKSTQQEVRSLQQTLIELTRSSNQQLSANMREQTRDIHERLSKASEIIGELKREAGAFSEISRSMKELDAFLKSPKLRGGLGERVLADLIGQVFPKQHFFLQHRFKNGSIVDAAIQTDAGILPIDSKFPMENFQKMIKGETQAERDFAKKEFVRDVKKHIDTIATKYILPEEGTMDFAMMYVPSETVYYEIAADDALLEYARHKRIYPVSPTTLYAHLQTILLSFEGKKIESKTRDVFAMLRGLQKSFEKFERSYEVLGKHLTNAHNSLSTTSLHLGEIGKGIRDMRHLEIADSSDETKELT